MNNKELTAFTFLSKHFYNWVREENLIGTYNPFLLAVLVQYLYTAKTATSTEIYTLPFTPKWVIPALSLLVQHGLVFKHSSKVGRAYVYSITKLGSTLVEECAKKKVPKYIRPEYRKKLT